MNLDKLQQTSYRFKARWWTRSSQIILFGVALLGVVIIVGLLGVRHVIRRSWPQTQGTLTVAGLITPVTVVRDTHGVPHFFAETQHDFYFAQGYIHAQDRFWGMELNRRRGKGTLAQLLQEKALATDELWRSLNLADMVQRQLAEMDAETRASLAAYAAGVNAWLDIHRERLPFEFKLLGWQGHGVSKPERWSAEDSLVIALVLSWQIGTPRVTPSLTDRIVNRVGMKRGELLLSGEPKEIQFSGGLSLQAPNALAGALPGRWALNSRVTPVSGDQTESGRPLLAVDLPTDLSLPTPWYVMTWHLADKGAGGASVPGLPGLVVGIEDQAIWETWSNPPYALLSLLKELDPGATTLPWQRWLLTALLSTGEVAQPNGGNAPLTADWLQAQQLDTFSIRASRLIPLLVMVEPTGWRQERVTGMLRKWDYRIGDNNKEAPFFTVYQLELARAAFSDELGDAVFEDFVAQSDLYQSALDQILEDPSNEWWDDVRTPERELQGDILKQAYEPALEWLGRNYGDLHMLWEWDVVHGSRLHHPLGDTWPWDQLLNRDFNPDGWADTTDASPGGLPCLGGVCMGGDFYRAKAVYGYRQIMDANDPSTLWFSLLPGQSGHPFHPHYDDLLDVWLAGKYSPLHLARSPAEVEDTESVLTLTPQD